MALPRKNPFAPGYGKRPPVFAGRKNILEDYEDALHSPQHPSTSMLLTGPRGIGKTVTLDQLADIARSEGWRVIRTSAVQQDWFQALVESIVRDHLEFTGDDKQNRITSIQAFGFGVDLERPERTDLSGVRLRQALAIHAKALAEKDTGLALLIDEIQSANLDDVRALGDDHQIVAESGQLPIVLTLAALPVLENRLEADNTKATFLQRMDRRTLERFTTEESLQAVVQPFEDHGQSFADQALALIGETVAGAPYFAQLLGFQLWKHISKHPADVIGPKHITHASAEAMTTYGRTVVDTLFNDLTTIEKTFLMAMAVDDGETDMADMPGRINRDPNYAYQYRHRLINAGEIYSSGQRTIQFVDDAIKRHIRTLPQYHEFLEKLNGEST